MAKVKWISSYKTLKFDTPDGDIHKGQYAYYRNMHYVRLTPENNDQFVALEQLDKYSEKEIAEVIKTMAEIHVVEGESMFYDEFELPDKRTYRESTNNIKYQDLKKENALSVSKTLTTAEIDEIKKDDSSWEVKPK